MIGAAVASKQHLEALITQATVDCYNEEEQATGLFTMIEEHVALPFKTAVLGREAEVVSIDMDEHGRLVAVCRAGRHRQSISLADLPIAVAATGRRRVDCGLPAEGPAPGLIGSVRPGGV